MPWWVAVGLVVGALVLALLVKLAPNPGIVEAMRAQRRRGRRRRR